MIMQRIQPLFVRVAQLVFILLGLILALNLALALFLPKDYFRSELNRLICHEGIQEEGWRTQTGDISVSLSWNGIRAYLKDFSLIDSSKKKRLTFKQLTSKVSLLPLFLFHKPSLYQVTLSNSELNLDKHSANILKQAFVTEPKEDPQLPISLESLQINLNDHTSRLAPIKGLLATSTQITLQQLQVKHAFHPKKSPSIEFQGKLYNQTEPLSNSTNSTPPLTSIYASIAKLPPFNVTSQPANWQASDASINLHLANTQVAPLIQWIKDNSTLSFIPHSVRATLSQLKGSGVINTLTIEHTPKGRIQKNPELTLKVETQAPWSFGLGAQLFNSGGPLANMLHLTYSPNQPNPLKRLQLSLDSPHHQLALLAKQSKRNTYILDVDTLNTDLNKTPSWLWSTLQFPFQITPPQGTLQGQFKTVLVTRPNSFDVTGIQSIKGQLFGKNLHTELTPNYIALRPKSEALHIQSLKISGKGKDILIQELRGNLASSQVTSISERKHGDFHLEGSISPEQQQIKNLHLTAHQLPTYLLNWLPVNSKEQQSRLTGLSSTGGLSLDATINQSLNQPPRIKGHLTLHPSQLKFNQNKNTLLSLPQQRIALNGNVGHLDLKGTLLALPFSLKGLMNWEEDTLKLDGTLPKIELTQATKNGIEALLQATSPEEQLVTLPPLLEGLSGEGTLSFKLDGSMSSPRFSGESTFQARVPLQSHHLPITGHFLWNPDHIKVTQLDAQFGQGLFHFTGDIENKTLTAHGSSQLQNISLSEALQFSRSLQPLLDSPSTELLAQFQDLKGTLNGELSIAHELQSKELPHVSGYIKAPQVEIQLKKINSPIKLSPLQFTFSSNNHAQLKPSQFNWGPLTGCLDGELLLEGALPQFNWEMETYPLSLATWKTHSNFYQQLSQSLHFPFPSPQAGDRVGGHASLYITGSHQEAQANLTLSHVDVEPAPPPASQHAVASWAMNDLNGIIQLSTRLKKGQLNHIQIKSNELKGQLQHGPISRLSLDGQWNIPQRHGTLDIQGDLYPQPERTATTDAPKTLAHLNLQTELNEAGTAHLHHSAVELANMGKIIITGDIKNVMTPYPIINASLTTPTPLNLEPFTSDILSPLLPLNSSLRNTPLLKRPNNGSLALDVHIVDTEDTGRILDGDITFKKVGLPLLNVRELDGQIRFEGLSGHLDINRLNLPGIDLGIHGTIQDVLDMPWNLEALDIQGPLFAIPAWEKYVDRIIEQRLVHGIIIPLFGPQAPADELPIQFHNADLAINEVIYDNLIIQKVRGNMLLGSSGYFELTNTQANVASGDIKANIAMQPFNNNFIRADLSAHNVKANALAQTLLNAPNQIFGDLNGNIQFTTQGLSPEEQMQGVNGAANFSITNGRLPSIAKLETVLTAANILRGGVVGLNLNNLFRVMAPFNTNYFAELSGSLTMNQGIAYTNDILSDGENLDLLIQGSANLLSGEADLKLYGDMSQNVNGRLGKLGRFSLISLLKYIPGIGYIPGFKNRSGLIQYLPGVGYVPGLGGPVDDKSRFEVILQGPLVDPRSIQDFNWVH